MLNSVNLIGRIANEIEVKELEKGKVTTISVAVPRSYKNKDGEYETDFIECTIWNELAGRVKEFCKKGDLIAIAGRLSTETYSDKEGNNRKAYKVIVEKVTFLQPKKTEE